MTELSAIKINVKRVYDAPSNDDGRRILVDRLWPRGLSKEKASVDEWTKALAPSHELRKWYAHEPEKWLEFKQRYAHELEAHEEELSALIRSVTSTPSTLLFSSKELKLNNAHALREFILDRVTG